LGQVLLTTSFLNCFANRDIDLWWGSNIVFAIELGDAGVVGVGVTSVGNSLFLSGYDCASLYE
jgi:hypothetical protein